MLGKSWFHKEMYFLGMEEACRLILTLFSNYEIVKYTLIIIYYYYLAAYYYLQFIKI